MHIQIRKVLPTFFALVLASPASWAALGGYSQDFEGLDAASDTALGDNGWNVGANVFAPDGTFLYNYFAFPAPNGGPGFSAIASGEGGPDQGAQQMVVYNDYNNPDHGNGSNNRIEANIFQAQTADAGDIGDTWTFSFDAKRGDLAGSSTATAFIKTFNGDFSFNPDFIMLDLTSIATDWVTYSLSVTLLDPSIVNVQFGFLNVASNFEPSGTVVDNVSWAPAAVVPVPAAFLLMGPALLGLLGFRRKNG